MPVSPTYPGLYSEELPSSAHTIVPAPTSITVFIGYTHPFLGQVARESRWNEAIQIFSYADYERIFGGLYRSFVPSDVADAVYQFFLNGGSNAYVVPLKPKNHGAVTGDVTPLSGDLSGIRFTSKHLTDSLHKVSITIRNVHPAPNDNIADIVVTFGSMLEQYRNVKLLTGVPGSITDQDFVDKRLANSNIVTVNLAPPAASYPAVFTAGTRDLGDMSPQGNVVDTNDFLEVFGDDKPLAKVEIFNLLAIPGITDNGVWSAALAYCEKKLAFFIMDPPRFASADDEAGAAFTKIQDLIDGFPHASPNGALYFPYLKTVDPIGGRIREEPPSGYVAGIYARTDMRRGVWKATAG